jgi:hypothetical protein
MPNFKMALTKILVAEVIADDPSLWVEMTREERMNAIMAQIEDWKRTNAPIGIGRLFEIVSLKSVPFWIELRTILAAEVLRKERSHRSGLTMREITDEIEDWKKSNAPIGVGHLFEIVEQLKQFPNDEIILWG